MSRDWNSVVVLLIMKLWDPDQVTSLSDNFAYDFVVKNWGMAQLSSSTLGLTGAE
jgi:hypothetical protein